VFCTQYYHVQLLRNLQTFRNHHHRGQCLSHRTTPARYLSSQRSPWMCRSAVCYVSCNRTKILKFKTAIKSKLTLPSAFPTFFSVEGCDEWIQVFFFVEMLRPPDKYFPTFRKDRCAFISTFKQTLTHDAHYSQTHPQQRTLTQHDMLPQHPVNILEFFCECF